MSANGRLQEPWYWTDIGSGPVLLASDRDRSVVLSTQGRYSSLARCDESGRLVALKATDPLAKQIAAIPRLLAACRALAARHPTGAADEIEECRECGSIGPGNCDAPACPVVLARAALSAAGES